ncbi:MAG: alpha/beta hydrolase family esterase [Gammaproteobacteria bacterium]
MAKKLEKKETVYTCKLLRVGLLTTLTLLGAGCAEDIELGEASYSADAGRVGCAPGTRTGRPGVANDQSTPDGIKYNVRTPLNYDPKLAHPLLMVYAPARRTRMSSERFTNLTREATRAGFVVVYADHRRLSPSAIIELGTIPRLVVQKWCIDEERIFLTGHSDGGTVAMGLAFISGTKDMPAAIAPSAVGINKRDLSERNCPDPISVMVMHSAKDRLFPGYGSESIEWWAACNGCDLKTKDTMDNGCVAYRGCANEVRTLYCEGDRSHPKWPGLNSAILEFFMSSGRS